MAGSGGWAFEGGSCQGSSRGLAVLWRKSLHIDPPPFGAGFCAGLFWASLVLLGVERAWSNFVTGVDWYKDGGETLRGMSGSRIPGLFCGIGLVLGLFALGIGLLLSLSAHLIRSTV